MAMMNLIICFKLSNFNVHLTKNLKNEQDRIIPQTLYKMYVSTCNDVIILTLVRSV